MEFVQTEKYENTIWEGIRYLSPMPYVKKREVACQVFNLLNRLNSNKVVNEILANPLPIEPVWKYYKSKLKKSLTPFHYDRNSEMVFIDGKPYVNLDDLPTIEECDISSADCDIQVCIPHKIYVAGIGESIVIGGKSSYGDIAGKIEEAINSLKQAVENNLAINLEEEKDFFQDTVLNENQSKNKKCFQRKQFLHGYNEKQITKLHELLVLENFLKDDLDSLLYYCGLRDVLSGNEKLEWLNSKTSLAYLIDKIYSTHFNELFPELMVKKIFVIKVNGESKSCENLRQLLNQVTSLPPKLKGKRALIYNKLDRIIDEVNEAAK